MTKGMAYSYETMRRVRNLLWAMGDPEPSVTAYEMMCEISRCMGHGEPFTDRQRCEVRKRVLEITWSMAGD